jgi:hypothetical protein
VKQRKGRSLRPVLFFLRLTANCGSLPLYLAQGISVNGYQRIGIIVSVIWALFLAVFFLNSQLEPPRRIYDGAVAICTEQPWAERKACNDRALETFIDLSQSAKAAFWKGLPIAEVATIALGWLIVYLLIWLTRWVRRGFQKA